MIDLFQCASCKHLRGPRDPFRDKTQTCDAFPDGIPTDTVMNRFDHTISYPGDRGIQFEPIQEAIKAMAESISTQRLA